MKEIVISGIRINLSGSSEILEAIKSTVEKGEKAVISNVNIHAMNIAYKNERMKKFLNNAHINFIDGDGVNLGAKILNLPVGPKVTYDWWIWDLAEFCASNALSWYILGSKESTLRTAIKKLKLRYPGLDIRGYQNGYFKKYGLENAQIIKEINILKPNILIIGMGMPVQEEWLLENWNNLDANVALTGGAVIDYISGEFKSTPDVFRFLKLEWFYRFLQRPAYLFKRYFIGNPLFIYRIFKEKIFGYQN